MTGLVELKSPYMQYFLKLDMREKLGDISCPVLALNGKKDRQVDAENNLNALSKGLPENRRTKIQAMDDLNHLFQHCETGATGEYAMIEETIAPEVLEMMGKWVYQALTN